MTTFTLSSEQSPEAILAFALSKGYQQDITHYKKDGIQEIEPNPVAPEDFVAQYFTQIIVNEMGAIKKQEIYQQQAIATNEAIQALNGTLASTITISIS